ncbi:Monoacylglycerol lipase ABHD12 [Stylophora pistillata]|uniref:Monoacylglycerol lipase ABHD12 n=1 Tax=Stylophora pistillata TaxID=50429 RepID=A0A2B4SA50_STYPI|nr:Monoacylglycerol lipase ABHD12 [Stylophora pistillata]
MTAENMSGRDPLSPVEEENLLSEENETANSSHRSTGKVLADVLSAMTQMSSTMLSMENAMKRLAGAPEDHATPLKRRRTSPTTNSRSDSGDSDPEKSYFEELNFPPNGDPPKLGSSDALLNEIAEDFESDEQTDPKVDDDQELERVWSCNSLQVFVQDSSGCDFALLLYMCDNNVFLIRSKAAYDLFTSLFVLFGLVQYTCTVGLHTNKGKSPFENLADPSSFGLPDSTVHFYISGPAGKLGAWNILSQNADKAQDAKTDKHSHLSDGSPVFLYFHGNGFTRGTGHRLGLYKLLTSIGYHVVTIDYRGFGDSEGKPSENGLIEDGLAAWKWIRSQSPEAPLYIWGHSLGSGVAGGVAKALCEEGSPPLGVILEAPFNNIWDGAVHHPITIPFRFLPYFNETVLDEVKEVFRTDKRLADVYCPILILHDRSDEIISFELGKKLYESAKVSRPADAGNSSGPTDAQIRIRVRCLKTRDFKGRIALKNGREGKTVREAVCASIYTIFLPRTLASNVEDANHFWELDYPEIVDNITCQPANITSQVPGGLKNMRSPAGTGVFVTGTSEINLNPDLAIECPGNPTRCTTGFSVSFLIKVTGPESCFNHYSFLFGNIVTQPLEQITDYIGFAVGMRTKYFEIVVVSDNFVCKGTLTWYRRNVWTHVAFSWKDPASSDSGLKVFNDASKSDLQKGCDLELRDRRPPRQTISLGSSTQSLLLSVEMDVLAIWNKRRSNSKLNAPWRHIQDNSRIPIVVDFNVVLLDLPWEPSLSDTESDEHEHLIEEFTEQMTNLNNSVKGIILGANVSGLRQLSDGKVTAKMSFNFYRSEWQTLLQSQETFENGTVLNSRIEILSCSATDECKSENDSKAASATTDYVDLKMPRLIGKPSAIG